MIYVDSSAIVKLVLQEPGWEALGALIERHPLISSTLTKVESLRAAGRWRADGGSLAAQWLDRVALMGITDAVMEVAAALQPPALRSLDAIHVATALELSDELECLVSYDARMLEAAVLAGIPVASPGA